MADFDADHWFKQVQSTPLAEHLMDGEKDELRTLLLNETFKKACNIAFQEATGAATQILGINLTNPEGVSKALQLQGKTLGMTRMLEGLIELAQEETEPLEEEQD